tara:strand:+ start:172 stop:2064 length:1893 start_codon:yes stop_codon:yes gene_type:complete
MQTTSYKTSSGADHDKNKKALLLTAPGDDAFDVHKFGDDVRRLYDCLMEKGEDVVRMADYEKQYRISWNLQTNTSSGNDDPYFTRLIYNRFERSCSSFCITLDLICTSLAGLVSDQTSHSTLEDMMRIRNHASNEIYKMMCSSVASNADVVAKAKQLEATYTPKHILKYRHEINEAIKGVRALACIAAASTNGHDMNEAMQGHYATARSVCLNPPKHLTEQMRAVGISLNVLSACFESSGHRGMVGASSLAPPWAKAVDIVTVFFSNAIVAMNFGSACVSALNLMRVECSEPDDSHVWCGVEIMDANSDAVVHASCVPTFDMVHALHAPYHRGGSTGKAMVVTNPYPPRALRVVRFLRMLVRCAECGYFDPRCARADILLSSVARFRTENRFFMHSTIDEDVTHSTSAAAEVDKLLHEEEEACSVPFVERDALSTMPPTIPTIPMVGNISSAVVPHNHGSTIPLTLERDYNIIQTFIRTIDVNGGPVFLRNICNILKASDGYFNGYSDRSVEQSVSHVIRKCLPRAQTIALSNCVMEYVACPTGQRGGGHINFDAAGAITMKTYIQTALIKMAQGDYDFTKEWHVSRSSRNKARANAVANMTGNDAHVSSVGSTSAPKSHSSRKSRKRTM